jgi:hypothetical protein
MSESQPAAMKALKAVYAEARQGRETAERLTPLLALLDPPERGEGSPLDPITDLLEAIMSNQYALLGTIEVLTAKVDGLAVKSR